MIVSVDLTGLTDDQLDAVARDRAGRLRALAAAPFHVPLSVIEMADAHCHECVVEVNRRIDALRAEKAMLEALL